jgi:sugar transferase (PEP-CTERM/EpsH1 system associated)
MDAAVAKPNVLYVTYRVPYPPNRGDRIRSYHFAKWIAGRSNLFVACFSEEGVSQAAREHLRGLCRQFAIVPLNPRLRWLAGGLSLAGGGSITAGWLRSKRLRRIIAAWASVHRFDVAVALCSGMAQYLDAPELASARKVVDLVDVDSQKWLDYARDARGWRSWLYRLEGRRVRRLEASLPKRGYALTVVSEDEAAIFRRHTTEGSLAAISNGVDLDYFQPTPSPRRPGWQCAFTGVLDYHPNVVGLNWFCQEIWPQVRREHPQANFVIIGQRPTKAVQRLDEVPGVVVRGPVPDVRPHMARADVIVVPLTIARGIPNKVLEAMAMGRPTVASPAALAGLQVQSGHHLLAAQSAGEFAAAVNRLLADQVLAARLGAAARQFVQQHHNWATCLAPFAATLALDAAPCCTAGDSA